MEEIGKWKVTDLQKKGGRIWKVEGDRSLKERWKKVESGRGQIIKRKVEEGGKWQVTYLQKKGGRK